MLPPLCQKPLFIADLCIIAIPLLAIKELPFVEYLFGFGTPEWRVVPIGIAFYSLQLMSYVIDVFMEKINPENNILHFIMYVTFFPQIIQGPIPRYSQLSNQLVEGHRFDEMKFTKGFMLIIWGFFLKLCIADKAGIVVNNVFDNYSAYRGVYVLVAGILYSFQLYADFMACTSLAQGIAELFGIELIDNFNHPYFAKSIKDFWRRWHISLSAWLKDYIYIPLGGNKKGKYIKYFNILVTFAVSGIWHGSGYKFLLWGLLHGSYQIIEDIFMPVRTTLYNSCKNEFNRKILDAINTLLTFLLVSIAWIIFRADHLKIGLSMIKSIVTVHNPWIFTNDSLFGLGLNWKEFLLLIFCLVFLFLVSKIQEQGVNIRESIMGQKLPVRWTIYILAIVFVMLFGTYGYGFDPQAFIYGGF